MKIALLIGAVGNVEGPIVRISKGSWRVVKEGVLGSASLFINGSPRPLDNFDTVGFVDVCVQAEGARNLSIYLVKD